MFRIQEFHTATLPVLVTTLQWCNIHTEPINVPVDRHVGTKSVKHYNITRKQ